jgi:hypothetical protein
MACFTCRAIPNRLCSFGFIGSVVCVTAARCAFTVRTICARKLGLATKKESYFYSEMRQHFLNKSAAFSN